MVHVHLKWYILKILDKYFWGVNLTLFGKKKQTGNPKKLSSFMSVKLHLLFCHLIHLLCNHSHYDKQKTSFCPQSSEWSVSSWAHFTVVTVILRDSYLF